MANEDRKTTSLVRLNSKLSAINLLSINWGGVAIEEGRFIVEDANQKGAKATPGALATGDVRVFLSFLDSDHGSVKDETEDKFDSTAPVLTQGTGGLVGIVGNGVPIGIHKSYWDLAGTPALGDVVIIGTDAMPKNQPLGTIAANMPYFGTIYRIVDDILWFIFETNGAFTGI